MNSFKVEFIKVIIDCGALSFGEFTTKSGRKTPYFINTGLFNTGAMISTLGKFYARSIINNKIKPDILMGPAYKGIPLVVATAISLKNDYGVDISYFFNRKESKVHGEGGNIIGDIKETDEGSVLIVDDVITAGTSIHESLEILKNYSKLKISGALISVDRQEKIEKLNLRNYPAASDFKIYSIITIDEILTYLFSDKTDDLIHLDEEMKKSIKDYRKKYGISKV